MHGQLPTQKPVCNRDALEKARFDRLELFISSRLILHFFPSLYSDGILTFPSRSGTLGLIHDPDPQLHELEAAPRNEGKTISASGHSTGPEATSDRPAGDHTVPAGSGSAEHTATDQGSDARACAATLVESAAGLERFGDSRPPTPSKPVEGTSTCETDAKALPASTSAAIGGADGVPPTVTPTDPADSAGSGRAGPSRGGGGAESKGGSRGLDGDAATAARPATAILENGAAGSCRAALLPRADSSAARPGAASGQAPGGGASDSESPLRAASIVLLAAAALAATVAVVVALWALPGGAAAWQGDLPWRITAWELADLWSCTGWVWSYIRRGGVQLLVEEAPCAVPFQTPSPQHLRLRDGPAAAEPAYCCWPTVTTTGAENLAQPQQCAAPRLWSPCQPNRRVGPKNQLVAKQVGCPEGGKGLYALGGVAGEVAAWDQAASIGAGGLGDELFKMVNS